MKYVQKIVLVSLSYLGEVPKAEGADFESVDIIFTYYGSVKMKAILQQVRRIPPSLKITSGIVLSGLILWYFLYGPCGSVPVKSSIQEMNRIFNGWQELRDRTIPEFSKNGEVSSETITIMQKWRQLAYELPVPGCLDGTRSNLIDAIESDYLTFQLAKDRISIEKKMEFLSSNAFLFVRYKQNVELIEACAPICNVGKDFMDLFEAFHK